ncbi:hypothetical protein N9K06_00335 [Omnitrophica bacterium]|nr:hypothetical protein [Candidatus Omnitrophota bacterium]
MKKIFFRSALFFFVGLLHTGNLSAETYHQVDIKMKDSETDHFKIFSQRDIDREDYLRLRQQLKKVRREAGQYLNIHPDEDFTVILTDPDVFHSYTGAPAQVIGLFDGKIHLPIPSEVDENFLKAVLWHEYAHAMVYSYTKGNVLVWLNEGMATYLESQVAPKDIRTLENYIRTEEKLPFSLDTLEMIFRSSKNQSPSLVSLAYSVSYVIADYLFKHEQTHAIKRLLKRSARTDIDTALRESLNMTESELARNVVRHVKRKNWD